MSTDMKMEEAMYLANKTYQDHNLKIWVKIELVKMAGKHECWQVTIILPLR